MPQANPYQSCTSIEIDGGRKTPKWNNMTMNPIKVAQILSFVPKVSSSHPAKTKAQNGQLIVNIRG